MRNTKSIAFNCSQSDSLIQLSILIPFYGRQKFALRNMFFWSGSSARVLVADGSPHPICSSELSLLKSNVQYHHLPNLSYELRLKHIAEYVNTEFSVICCDDDFLLPSTLVAATQFLYQNTDYTSCGGRCIGFNYVNRFLILSAEKKSHVNYNIIQDSPIERIFYHISNFNTSTYYSVHRSKNLLNTIQFLRSYKNGGYTNELKVELLNAANGKSFILQEPLWLRSFENSPVYTDNWDRNISLSDWYYNTDNLTEVLEMFEILFKAVSALEKNVGLESIKASITSIINIHMEKSRINLIYKKKLQKKKSFYKFFQQVKFLIKCSYIKIFGFEIYLKKFLSYDYFYSDDLYSYENLIRINNIEVSDIDGLNNIWKVILKFHSLNIK